MDTRTSYVNSFMTSLKRLRDTDSCDVTLKLRDQSTIHCHKLVLMAASPFFETMFRSGLKESTQREVELDLSPLVAKRIIDYFYSGTITIHSYNVQDLIAASEYLCLVDLKKHLEAFMINQIDSTNCIEFYRFARFYSLGKLVPHCLDYIWSHFNETFSASKKFEKLSEEELIEVVSDDRLTTENEDVVFHSVVRWVNADCAKRNEAFSSIAPFIRFPFCTKDCLTRMLREPLMMNPTCVEFLHEGFSLDVKSNRFDLHSTHNARVVPRHAFDATKPHLLIIRFYKDNTIVMDPRIYVASRITESVDELGLYHDLRSLNHSMYAESILFTESPKAFFWKEWQSEGNIPQHSGGHGKIFSWDVDTQKITESAWVEPQRFYYELMLVRGKMFVFGGTKDGKACKTVESFDELRGPYKRSLDPKWNPWKPEPAMLRAVTMPYVVQFESKVYVLGGRDENGPLLCTQEFDLICQTWQMKKDMPGACQSGAAVSLNEFIYVVGGTERACFRYTPATDTWTVLSRPVNVASTTATAWKGNILLCGKEHGEKYNVAEDAWCSCDALIPKEKAAKDIIGIALFTIHATDT